VLEAAEGSGTREIARELDTTPTTVSLWRGRFARQRLDGLEDLPRSGAPPIYTAVTDRRIRAVLDQPPPKGFARWSGPLIAEALGDVDVQYVWRSLRKQKIDLGGRKSWCESNDPQFAAKAADVVGLYMAPPKNAIVICVDEKPSIQALERAQGYLKLPNGRTLTGHSHDYKRNGTTTLFAALNMLDGKVIGQCQNRHRHQEWLKFMRRLDREFPPDLTLHMVMDNYGTHKTPVVKAWMAKHPRFICHFIPTSSSWLNMVERWFRKLTDKAIRRGVFVSVPDLEKSIADYLAAWNEKPRPFIWTATVGDIVAKLARAREKLETIKPGCTQPRQRKTKPTATV